MNRAELWQRPEELTLLRGWTRDGVSLREIARRMDIRPLTLRLWRRKYPAIDEALRQSGELTDYRVEDALLKAAMGYRYTEEKREQTDKGDKLVSTEKEVSPSVTAISLWLKRRRPEIWDEEHPPGEEKAENNLFQALGDWQEEVTDRDAIPELFAPAKADGDMVEAGAPQQP